MTSSSQINTGDGKDTINIDGNMYSTSKISTAAGNDEVFMKGSMYNSSIIDLGTGDDTFYYGGGNISGKVNAGIGNDTFVYTGSRQNLDISDTTGFELFNINGTGGRLNLTYQDLVDAGTKKVFVNGTSTDTVDLGNNGGSVSSPSLNGWTKSATGVSMSDPLNTNHTYDVYIKTDETVYIEQGIQVI